MEASTEPRSHNVVNTAVHQGVCCSVEVLLSLKKLDGGGQPYHLSVCPVNLENGSHSNISYFVAVYSQINMEGRDLGKIITQEFEVRLLLITTVFRC